MATAPTSLPIWATTAGVNDLIEPLTAKKESGWAKVGGIPEKPPYQTFNWWQNLSYQWTAYFSVLIAGDGTYTTVGESGKILRLLGANATVTGAGAATFADSVNTPLIIVNANSATAAFRITQTGAGNAFVVEDSTNPDATPFIIDAVGRVIQGHTGDVATCPVAADPSFQIHGLTNNASSIGFFNWSSNAALTQVLQFARSVSNTVGTRGAVTASGTGLGCLSFAADNGTNFLEAARIEALLDATGGAADIPGRLVFSTTTDGTTTLTERMRIDSAGLVTIAGDLAVNGGDITSTSGTLAIGVTTAATVLNLSTGATINGSTKTVNICTGGVDGSTVNATLVDTVSTTTVNISTGATVSGKTKTINIGTGGVSGSTTVINIGATAGTRSVVFNGSTLFGHSTASGNLTLESTSNATHGSIFFGAAGEFGSISSTGIASFPKNVVHSYGNITDVADTQLSLITKSTNICTLALAPGNANGFWISCRGDDSNSTSFHDNANGHYFFAKCTQAGAWSFGNPAGSNNLNMTVNGRSLAQAAASGSTAIFTAYNSVASATSATWGYTAQFTVDADVTGGYYYVCQNSSGTIIGRIEAASNTTTTFTGSSDSRMKTNATTFTGIDKIKAMIPRQFEWVSNPGKSDRGFYAQELYEVYPEAVSVGNDDLTPDNQLRNPWGIDYGRLTPVIVQALKELIARVEALEA